MRTRDVDGPKRRALIADATNIPESRQLGLALREAGFEVSFHTSCELGSRSLVGRLAGIAGARGRRYAARRRHPELDELTFRNWLLPDLANAIARRGLISVPAGYRIGGAVIDAVAWALALRRPDVLVLRQGGALWALRRARRLGIRTVLLSGTPDPAEERSLVEAEARQLGLDVRPAGRSQRALERRIRLEYRLADVVLVGSELGAESICRAGERPRSSVIVLPLSYEARPVPAGDGATGNGSVRVLFVGSVYVRKGVHHLVAAVRELSESGRDLELDVIGPIRDKAYAQLLEARRDERTRLRGPVAGPLLPQEYRSADVFVLPSLSDGFGMVVPEARAYGLPVITTDRCGAPVRDGEDGFVVPAGDTSALRDALETLVDDAALRRRMGQAALASAGSWTWADYREAAQEHVERVLRGSR